MNQLILMIAMAVAAALGATGQMMLKKASETVQPAIASLALNKYLWIFVLVYGTAVIINLVAYKLGGRVSVLYPVISLSYIFSAVAAWKWLGEPFNWWTLAGCIVIIAGVSLIGYGAGSAPAGGAP